MVDSKVTPKAVIGNPLTGIGAEPIRSTFGKYNQHDHARASAADFYVAGCKIGEVVQVESVCGDPVVAPNTTIVNFSRTQLTLSSPAIYSTTCTLKVGTHFVYGCKTTATSTLVTFEPNYAQHGFIESSQLLQLATVAITGTLYQPIANESYSVLLRSPCAGYVSAVYGIAQTGTATIAMDIRGEDFLFVRRQPLFTASVAGIQAAVFNDQGISTVTRVEAGQSISFFISAASATPVIGYTLYFVRCLPNAIIT